MIACRRRASQSPTTIPRTSSVFPVPHMGSSRHTERRWGRPGSMPWIVRRRRSQRTVDGLRVIRVSRSRPWNRTCSCPACDRDNGGLSFCGSCRFHNCTPDTVNCGGELATDGGRIVDEHDLQVARVEHEPDEFSNPAFRTAYRKGALAARTGAKRTACPYPDHRQDSGRLTFSRAFRKEWHRGYDHEQRAESHERRIIRRH